MPRNAVLYKYFGLCIILYANWQLQNLRCHQRKEKILLAENDILITSKIFFDHLIFTS